MMVQTTGGLCCICVFGCAVLAAAEPIVPVDGPLAPDILQVLEAEQLDTIVLDVPAFFQGPDRTTAHVPPGTYRVERVAPSGLRLVAKGGQPAIVIAALETTHVDAIESPVALKVPDKNSSVHVVLLSPEGKGLDAIGSYLEKATRAGLVGALSPTQLHEALARKLAARVPPPKGNSR